MFSNYPKDEIYHIPQAQKYCHENFLEWDPKITTFPGLYITSYIIYKLLALLSLHIKCSVTFLRATNTGLSFIILFALYKVCSKVITLLSYCEEISNMWVKTAERCERIDGSTVQLSTECFLLCAILHGYRQHCFCSSFGIDASSIVFYDFHGDK